MNLITPKFIDCVHAALLFLGFGVAFVLFAASLAGLICCGIWIIEWALRRLEIYPYILGVVVEKRIWRASERKKAREKSRERVEEKQVAADGDEMKLRRTLAWRFAMNLRGTVGNVGVEEIVRRNEEETDPLICHSHDLCDSNTVMDASFTELQLPNPVEGSGDEFSRDLATARWNDAWAIAMHHKFSMNRKDYRV